MDLDHNEIDIRWNQLEKFIRNKSMNDPISLSIDALMDAILLIYNQCSNITGKREKPLNDFVESSTKLFFRFFDDQ